ncbi:hypothetical protein AMS68_000463 [Peltaster fructicola]|uniref:histidine kinase n=1 Tax=Peltaster fructicola TaxID=286661 RepID=A0A6H0XJQ5_9PEZI|nr:hypothetical protein AMS68_000463 [Peltaster fructicola]
MDTFEVTYPEGLTGDKDRRERRREREFYKYYEPICALSPLVTSHVNLFDKSAAAQHIPRSSPDRSLTAFCQLGALRLEARRCLLFFFDCENAYVLAEATRTLSLVDDEVHDDQDALWLGNVVIPRGLSVCEHTVNIPEANHGSNKHDKNAGIVHIINNLKDDTRFCDRPFVTEGPLARFYAGVPIVTPNGYRIGAFCILDDKPRDGISDGDVAFLCQMGQTIMDHIETVRSRAEFSRGARMLTSMESFFSSAPVAAADPGRKFPAADNVPAEVSIRPEYFGRSPAASEHNVPRAASIEPTVSQSIVADAMTPLIDGGIETSAKISPAGDELDIALEQNVKNTFGLAATLIRSATDIDGMVFLELGSRTRKTAAGATRLSRGNESDVDSLQSLTESTSTDGGRTTDTENDVKSASATACPVLGSSLHTERCPGMPHIDMIPPRLLSALLRRYPNGKVWYFDSAGDVSQGESSSSDHLSTKTSSSSSTLDDSKPQQRQRRSRARESRDVQQLFPGVRALGIITLWDHGKNRIRAGGIMWTYSPVRILTAEGDLAFLRAFSDVIMSNVARLTSRMEDQAKSDFISSISHELRSPLHGILGSIDFLQEQEGTDQTIVAQIERCSVTLMDVIEHLLEFAKINNLTHSHTNAGQGSRVRAWLDNSSSTQNRMGSVTKLTEEVADATFYSHCCNQEIRDHGNVAFVLDVASQHLENVKVPVGAWKRLCINIINNALKYTTGGHISVSLKASHRQRRRPIAVLTVTDTGCGMSRDFLEHSLFKAFSQENSLANGTGLGMSLAAKLVRNMHGKIEVQSTKNVGTTIRVSIPFDTKDIPTNSSTNKVECRVRLPRVRDSSDLIKQNDRTLQQTALERACKLIGAQPCEGEVDITLLLEGDVAQVLASEELKKSVSANPVILLCTSFASAAVLRHSALAKALNCHVEFIPQPYGPLRLAEAMKKCLGGTVPAASSPVIAKLQSMSIADLNNGSSHSALDIPAMGVLEPSLANQHSTQQLLAAAAASLLPPTTAEDILTGPSLVEPFVQPKLEAITNGDDTHRPLSLLIVDDNRINVRVLMAFADKYKYPRTTASNGEEAVLAYEAASLLQAAGASTEEQNPLPKPDVVLMDLQMPVCDGWEATRRIRAFERSNGIPKATIIALTGLGSNDAHQEARAAGVDIFLTKPVRPKDLRPLLQSVEQGMRENAER